VVEVLHGVSVADPYRWLEEVDAPDVRAWVNRESAATQRFLGAAPARAALAARLALHARIESRGLPVRAGDWHYWTWNDGTREHALVVRGRTPDRHTEVVLDPNQWPYGAAAALAGLAYSPHGAYLAFGVTEGGSDWRTWRVLDLATLVILPDVVPWVRFNTPAWTDDERGFYYGAYPPADERFGPGVGRMTLRHHELGAALGEDRLVLEDPARPERSFAASVSDDGRWLVVSVFEGADPRNRLYFQDLERPDAPFVCVFDGFDADYEAVANQGSTFWVRTTKGAPNGQVLAVDVADEGAEPTTFIAEGSAPIVDALRAGDVLVVERLVDTQSRLDAYALPGATTTRAPSPAQAARGVPLAQDLFRAGGTAVLAGASARDHVLHFGYTDTTTPLELWSVDTRNLATERVFAPRSSFQRGRYTSSLEYATSADGTQVPVLVTRAKALAPGRAAPCILYGYGGFNVPVRAAFTPAAATWLELGGVLATAHVRGGGEYGALWHAAGIREHKPRAIEDFLAAAAWLVDAGWTQPSSLAIRGESNGGLLVGAALVRAPERFGAAITLVGVHDMLRYHRSGVGWAWTADYGTADDAALFPVLRAYSPYHNTRSGVRYPATLVSTATGDDRVSPAHSYKFAAALRHANAGDTPILLRTEPDAGHAGAARASARLAAALDEWCFLTLALGLDTREVERALED
jgi:prolyl oligopeptidase